MILIVQPELIERVVFESTRSDAALINRYQRRFADCYKPSSPDERDRAFRELHEEYFKQLGFRHLIAGLIARFPRITGQVQRVIVARAVGRNTQSCDLYGQPGAYSVAICVAVPTLLDRNLLIYWLAHELMHIDDILDPAFRYDRDARPEGESSAAQTRSRERFAVLWAISIDARLAAHADIPADVREHRCRELARAFGMEPSSLATRTFDELWTRMAESRPTHQDLIKAARAQCLSGDFDNGLSGNIGLPRVAGAPCPLCSFPTFDWADEATLQSLSELLVRAYPNWAPGQGICSRCAELHRARPDGLRTQPVATGLRAMREISDEIDNSRFRRNL